MAGPLFDFTTEAGRRGWSAAHDLAPLTGSKEGLEFSITGGDPYAYGPSVMLAESGPRWLVLRLHATESGMGQVFYFQDGPTEANSVRFPVRAERWETVRVALPPLRAGEWKLRLDPPGATPGARATVGFLAIEPRIALVEPEWPAPGKPVQNAGQVVAGGLALECAPEPGGLTLRFGGSVLARGHNHPLLGWQETPEKPLYFEPFYSFAHTEAAVTARGGMRVVTRRKDRGGAEWVYTLEARPERGETIGLTATLQVDRARVLVHFPALCLLAQATLRRGLFAGVEYLDQPDLSSSEADLRGPQALRHVPEAHLPTLPLMAIQGEGRWLALEWDPESDGVPCFDSPARTLGATEGHLLALLLPAGSRPPGSRLPHAGRALRAGEVLTARATLRAGRGGGVGEAVNAYLASHTLPHVPKLPGGWEATLAAGWLDAKIHEGSRWRHAWPGEFSPSAAADAVGCQTWLAARLERTDPALAARLTRSATEGRRMVPPTDLGGIGHVAQHAAALVDGDLPGAAREARARARALIERIAPDGTVPYTPPPGRTDYGTTHFEKTANGLSAQPLLEALRALTLAPESRLLAEALVRLRQLDARWKDTAPRGAQTWEVPLHTPDILASAHLVAACVLAYELSADATFLAMARRWALTGVAFVYLRDVATPIGVYATTPVLGATNWEAPNWIGLPVQWCGLVYADALFDLAVHDPKGPWKTLADGICASGMQQTWPRGQGVGREGLLPDSFQLPGQIRNDVCINPATVQVPLARSLGQPLYSRRALAPGGPIVHAPGSVTVRGPQAFEVRLWPTTECIVFLAGLPAVPRDLTVNGKPATGTFDPGTNGLALRLTGRAEVAWR
jgi:hypothetical protein